MELTGIVAIAAALGCVPWLVALAVTVLMVRRLESFARLTPPDPPRWPRLSVIVPACNEAAHLEAAARTLLAQDYPDLELVLVDDRSTDATGAIIDRLAADDARVRALHITALPDGWLGKVHALHEGAQASSGALLLFTDADVRFTKTALRRAVALVEARGLDHFTLVPDLQSKSALANLCIATALRAIAMSQRPWRAPDPRHDEAVGSGAFNLVRRAAFERTEGFSWLRLDVADDLALALLMKRSGAKVGLAVGVEDVRVPWYETFGQAMRGMEKNAFAQIARFRVSRGVSLSLLYGALSLSPLVTFLPLGVPHVWIAGATALLANAANALVLWRGLRFSPLVTFLSAPVGDLLLVLISLRATILGARRGGLVWRGTLYPTAALRGGMRVRF